MEQNSETYDLCPLEVGQWVEILEGVNSGCRGPVENVLENGRYIIDIKGESYAVFQTFAREELKIIEEVSSLGEQDI